MSTGGSAGYRRDMSADAIHVTSIREDPARASESAPARESVFLRGVRAVRRAIGRNWLVELCWKILVGLVGAVIIVVGIILLPTPGPGWLIIFAGLAVLATEFRWAKRVAAWLKRQLARFWAWWKRRRAARREARAQRR